MILSDTEILAAMERRELLIDPFNIEQLGGNSYDVRLGSVLRVYDNRSTRAKVGVYGQVAPGKLEDVDSLFIDPAVDESTFDIAIGVDGVVLCPGILYLASTVEYTETHKHVPYLDGKSSIGRLGIFIHTTAGRGDVGFAGHWTMEISVVQPVRVYAGMPIGQLTYHTVHGEVGRRYQSKPGASYLDGRDPMPQPSRLWRKLQRR